LAPETVAAATLRDPLTVALATAREPLAVALASFLEPLTMGRLTYLVPEERLLLICRACWQAGQAMARRRSK
jgi:hypothetical protein